MIMPRILLDEGQAVFRLAAHQAFDPVLGVRAACG
jgi:hypothetical protein